MRPQTQTGRSERRSEDHSGRLAIEALPCNRIASGGGVGDVSAGSVREPAAAVRTGIWHVAVPQLDASSWAKQAFGGFGGHRVGIGDERGCVSRSQFCRRFADEDHFAVSPDVGGEPIRHKLAMCGAVASDG